MPRREGNGRRQWCRPWQRCMFSGLFVARLEAYSRRWSLVVFGRSVAWFGSSLFDESDAAVV